MPDKVPRAGREKASCNHRLLIIRPEHIAGDLFLKKSVVWLVFIQCADHIIAIPPRVVSPFVAFKTVCVRVVSNIQPVSRKTFPVIRRFQYPV